MRSGCWAIAATAFWVATAARPTSPRVGDDVDSNVDASAITYHAADEGSILQRSANVTKELRSTVSGVFHKSTEQMKTLTSLLKSSAKGTDQIKTLMLEMVSLDKRMTHFTRAMEECHHELKDLESRDDQILSPQQANDPLLNSATA